MTHSARAKGIGGLLVMESAGWLVLAIAVAGFWHKQYPAAEATNSSVVSLSAQGKPAMIVSTRCIERRRHDWLS